MPKIQYVGSSHYRLLEASDWKNLGIEDQGKVVWDRDNRGGDGLHSGKSLAQIHDLPQEAIDALLAVEPKSDYKIVDDAPVELKPTTGDDLLP